MLVMIFYHSVLTSRLHLLGSQVRKDNVKSLINHVNQMILERWKIIARPKIIEATKFLSDLPDSMRYLNPLCTFWTNNDEMRCVR